MFSLYLLRCLLWKYYKQWQHQNCNRGASRWLFFSASVFSDTLFLKSSFFTFIQCFICTIGNQWMKEIETYISLRGWERALSESRWRIMLHSLVRRFEFDFVDAVIILNYKLYMLLSGELFVFLTVYSKLFILPHALNIYEQKLLTDWLNLHHVICHRCFLILHLNKICIFMTNLICMK
jgi:hypothetical protein